MVATTRRTPDDRTVPVFEAVSPETLVETPNPDLIRAAIELLETETDAKRVVAVENRHRARPGILRLCHERAAQTRQTP
jgi:hypothetical protein